MANTYSKIVELAAKNQMGLSNTIKRDFGIPLDYSSVQENYEAALNYAKTSTLAYIGQPISVGDTLYVVSDAAGGYLKPVGTRASADESSITISEDGKITIKGFEAAQNATLPRKKADGTLEWVPIDAIVAGDGNTKTLVKAADDSAITVTDNYNAETDTHTYTVDVELPAISDYTVTKTVGTGKTTYKVTKDGEQVGEAIEVPDAYDDKALTGRVASIEATQAEQGSSLAGVKEKVDAFFAAVEDPDEVIDTLVEIQKYIEDDKTGAASMAASIKAVEDKVEELTGDGANSVDNKISAAILEQATEDAAKYATKDALAEVSAVASAAAVKKDVDTALAGKADKAELDNYYKKNETYTRAEVDDLLDDIQGGSSETADSVKRQLDTHAAENTAKFAAVDKKDAEQDAAIQANEAAITAINNETTGILAKAKADAQAKVTALEEGAVAANAEKIAAVEAKIATANGNVTDLTGRVSTLEQGQSTLEAEVKGIDSAHKTLAETVGGHTTDIKALQDKVTAAEADIASNTAKFANYSTTTQMNAAIDEKIAALDADGLREDVEANTAAIEAEVARAKARENEIAGLVSGNTASIGENASEIARIDNVLKAAIENDGEGLDSIKELATWVEEHESEVLPEIQKNTEAIAKLNGDGEGSVKKAVADAIGDLPYATALQAGLVKASNEITVTADGVLGLGQVSTDKLVQGQNELVLIGGTSQ